MTKEKHEKRLSQDDILRLLFSIDALCQRRAALGSIPWDAKGTQSRNALTEIHRIDGLIVEKVLELYEYQQIGSRLAEGFCAGFKGYPKKRGTSNGE